MFLEISNNNGTKYIRICESVRVLNPDTNKSVSKKKTIKNIGPVSKYDDGKPDFIARLKTSYNAGNPILDELKPYINKDVPQEVYNIRLCEGTDECIAHPKLISNLLFERIIEELDLSQLIRTYKNHYDVGFDVYGFFKLLLFGRILNPASKWKTVKQRSDYAIPVVKGDICEFNIYKTLDFVFEHRSALFNRINTTLVRNYNRTTDRIFYDVTNFYFEIDDADEDITLFDGKIDEGLRKKGVSKENQKTPIVQMGLLMDEQGIPISIESFPGNTLDHQTVEDSFDKSVDSVTDKNKRFVFVCDKGIGKGEAIVYAISNGHGYLTSRSVRGSSKKEKEWIIDPEGYTAISENFKYKTKTVPRTVKKPDGTEVKYSEKILTYWSKKYYDKELAEKKSFYEFVEKYLEDPASFRVSKTQMPVIKKYLKKDAINEKTGELIEYSDLTAILDTEKLKMDYDLLGYYTLATSEIKMEDMEMLRIYGNLVEIEDQFRVMKSTLDARPVFVRTKEHIIAHLSICTIALILIRLIQKKLKQQNPSLVDDDLLFSNVLSAERIQDALNKWKIERLGDTYYRFCDIDDPDLALILSSFNINIPKKCFKISEVKQLKSRIEMSM
jgi:Transposase